MPETPGPVPESHKSERQNSPERTQNHPSDSVSPLQGDASTDANRHTYRPQDCEKGAHDNPDILIRWFTGIVAFAAVLQVVTTCAQWNVMDKQLLASRRPWVGVEINLTADMEATEQGYSIKMKYTTQNQGTSPAVSVYIHPRHGLWTPGVDVDGAQREACEIGKDPSMNAIGGHDLFPTQKYETPSAFDISKSEMEQSFEVYLQVLRKTLGKDALFTAINPFIVGCVTYRSTFDNTIHRTPYSVMLVWIDPKIIGNFLGLDTRTGTFPIKSIFVRPSPGVVRAD